MKKEKFDYPKQTAESLLKRQAEIVKVMNLPNHGLSDNEFCELKRELNNIDLKLEFSNQFNPVNQKRGKKERYAGEKIL